MRALVVAALVALASAARADTKPPPEPDAVSQFGSYVECADYRAKHPRELVIIFDGSSGSFDIPRRVVYGGTQIKVCVSNADHRLRYRLEASFAALPSNGELSLLGMLKSTNLTGKLLSGMTRGTPDGDAQEAAKALLDHVFKIKGFVERFADPQPLNTPDARQMLKDLIDEWKLIGEARSIMAKATTAGLTTDDGKTLIVDRMKLADEWLVVAAFLRDHLVASLRNFFTVTADEDHEVTVVIHGSEVVVGKGDPPELHMAPDHELGSQRFSVRSLSWVRLNIGVVYSGLPSRSYRIGTNDIGASVIQSSLDSAIIPTLMLTHYWCGADLHELQPYDRNRSCWWMNAALPTVTIGIPLDRNPLVNWFFGLTLQPVPGIAAVAGVHVGHLNVLRSGFGIDGSPPPASTGFRIEDAVTQKTSASYFVGAVLTDSIIIKLIHAAGK